MSILNANLYTFLINTLFLMLKNLTSAYYSLFCFYFLQKSAKLINFVPTLL